MAYQGKDDKLLTRLAVSYPLGNLVGTQVAPIAKADTYADSVYKDADDAINLSSDLAEASASKTIDFDKSDKYSYKTERHALNTMVTDKVSNNESQIINSLKRNTMKLTHKLRLMHEYRVATIMKDTSTKITQTAALTGTDRFDNASYAKNFIEKKIPAAVATIKSSTGASPNTIVIPYEVANYWSASSEISDLIRYEFARDYLEGEGLTNIRALAGMPPAIRGLKVVIADNRTNDSNRGATASKTNIWGKNVWIGYVPNNTMVEDTHGLITMEYDPLRVYTEKIKDPNATKVVVEWDYDIMEADLNVWYCYTGAIS